MLCIIYIYIVCTWASEHLAMQYASQYESPELAYSVTWQNYETISYYLFSVYWVVIRICLYTLTQITCRYNVLIKYFCISKMNIAYLLRMYMYCFGKRIIMFLSQIDILFQANLNSMYYNYNIRLILLIELCWSLDPLMCTISLMDLGPWTMVWIAW